VQRRQLLAALAVGLAAPRLAWADGVRRIPLAQAFRYLDSYLALAPALRSRFHLGFRALRNERPAPDLRAAIVVPGASATPLPLDTRGEVMQLPTLGELKKSNAVLEVAGDGVFRFATEIRPDVPPSTRIDAIELAAALSQANVAIAHLAGPFDIVAPKLDIVLFPDAGSGQAVLDDGRVAPLPVTNAVKALGPAPYYDPDTMRGVRVLSLTRPPSRIILAVGPL
jgi:hypothetical protein